MDYRINLGGWRRVFAVPSLVADRLKLISGEQLKVLLYLLANADCGLKSADIAEACGIEECDVDDALVFWEKNMDLISGEGGEYTPSESAPYAAAPIKKAPRPAVTPEMKVALTAVPQFEPKEIAEAVNSDRAVKYLFELFEKLSGRPTKHNERNTIMNFVDDIGMKPEVAAMLIEYCFSIDKASPAYMRTVALDWAESGIDSIAKAEERIREWQARYTLESTLRSKFGLNSAFSAKQKETIAEWSRLNVPEKLIDSAYDACMKNVGKLSLPYMDKTIRKWLEQGISDPGTEDKKPAAKEETGSSFDIDELQKLAYDRYKTTI